MKTDNETELKPCPFCKGENTGILYMETYSIDSSYNLVGCKDCEVGFEMPSEYTAEQLAEAIKAWNSRPEPTLKSSEGLVEVVHRILNGNDVDTVDVGWAVPKRNYAVVSEIIVKKIISTITTTPETASEGKAVTEFLMIDCESNNIWCCPSCNEGSLYDTYEYCPQCGQKITFETPPTQDNEG